MKTIQHEFAQQRVRFCAAHHNALKQPAIWAFHLMAEILALIVKTRSSSQTLDRYKLFVYCVRMIRNFATADTEQFYSSGKSRRFPPEILKRAAMRLTQLDAATRIEDLKLPPSNRQEALAHDRAGQWSIRINDQWRVCFRFENGDALDVEIVDYH